jgi:hypothetical protein
MKSESSGCLRRYGASGETSKWARRERARRHVVTYAPKNPRRAARYRGGVAQIFSVYSGSSPGAPTHLCVVNTQKEVYNKARCGGGKPCS